MHPVKQVGAPATANATNVNLTLPATPTVGNVMVAVFGVSNAATTITPPAGWSTAIELEGGSSPSGGIYYRVVVGGDGTSYNFVAGSSGQVRGQLIELQGLDTTDLIVDADAQRVASAATASTPSIVTDSESIAVAGMLGAGGCSAIDFGQRFTRLAVPTNRSRSAVRTLRDAGTYSTTATWTTAQASLMAIAAFRVDPDQLSQFGRPETPTVSTGDWQTNNSATDAPTLTLVIQEEVSDDGDEENLPHAIRTNANPNNEPIEYSLTLEGSAADLADPGVNTGHVLHYSYRSLLSGATFDLTIQLRQGGTVIKTIVVNPAFAMTYGSTTLSEAEAANITDYTDLRLRFYADQTGGTSDRCTIHMAALEIPAVAVGGPEAKAGSDTPSVSVAESSSLSVDASGADTPALSATESASLSVDAIGSDAPAVSLSESAALLASSDLADTVALGLVESASVEVLEDIEPKAGSDTAVIGLIETAEIFESRIIAASDTASIGLIESASVVEPPPPDPDPIGLVHRFTSADGLTTRTLPELGTHPMSLVGNFQGFEVAPGGYDAASGEISQDEYAANSDLYVFGTKWKVERDGVVIWSGTLSDPDDSGATVILKGLGSATEAEKNFERAMWLTRDMSEWTVSDSDPFSYDVDTNKIKAEVRGQEHRFWVTRNTAFRSGNNDKSGTDGEGDFWATGLLRWFPTVDVRGISFDVTVSRASDDYKIQVLSAPTLNGALTIRGTFTLLSSDLTNKRRTVDCSIPAGNELVMVRLRRKKLEKKAPRFTARCKDVAVRGLASDDQYKTHEVINDLAVRVQPTWDRTAVQVSTQRVGPLDTQGESAATIMDDLGALDDWRWLALDDEWEWGPWDTRVWQLLEGRFPRALVPLDRFNAVEIPFRYGGGYVSSKTVTAVTYVGGTPLRVYRIELDRPPPEDIATVFAQHIADYLWTFRKAGTWEGTWVEALGLPGIEVDAWRAHAGDTAMIDDLPLRITSKSFTDTTVQFSFDDSHPLLRKLEARRTRALALGQGQAKATLGQLGLERPKTPTNVVISFDFEKTRKQGRRYDAIVNWDEVTEDIEAQATAIGSYVAEYRYVRPDASRTRRRQVHIKAQGDDDDPNDPIPTQVRIRDLDHPHLWQIETHVWAVDALGKESAPTTWSTPVKPANWTPPAPTGVTYELNRKKLDLEFDLLDPTETETDGSPTIDRDVSYVRCKRFKNDGGGWVQQGKTLRLFGTQKTWAVRKPRGKSFKAQLWSVGDHGNVSTMVEVNATRRKPNKPTVRSRRRSPRRIEWVLNPPTTWSDGTSDDFDQDSVEAYDYTVLQNDVVDEDRSDHHRKSLNFSIEIPLGSTGWKLRANSKGVDGEDSVLNIEDTTINDVLVSAVTDIDYVNEDGLALAGGNAGTDTAMFGNAAIIPSFIGSDDTLYSGGGVPSQGSSADCLRYRSLLIELDRPTTLDLHGLCEWSNEAGSGADFALLMWIAVYLGTQPPVSGAAMTHRVRAASGRDGGYAMRMFGQTSWGRTQLSNMRSVFVEPTGVQSLGLYWEYGNSTGLSRGLSIYRQRLKTLLSYSPDKVSGSSPLWTPSTITRTAYLFEEPSD